MFHKAFTLFELVVVIVVISILSLIIIPKIDNNRLYYAANQVLFHIRYTQHLALIDNIFSPDDRDWFKKRWQIQFHSKVGDSIKWSYSIYRDLSLSGNANSKKELAKNPMNRNKLLSGGFHSVAVDDKDFTESMRLGNSFGIEDIIFEGECGRYGSKRLAFNYDGAPYYGNIKNSANPFDKRLTEECKIVLCLKKCQESSNDEKVTITIEPETGYASLCNL